MFVVCEMSTYKMYSGYTSLQNDLIKLLNGVSTKDDSDPEYTNDDIEEESTPEITTAEVISKTIHNVGTKTTDSDFEEQYPLDTDIKGGADIIGLVSNILEGGGIHTNNSSADEIVTDTTLVRDEANTDMSDLKTPQSETTNNPIKDIVNEVLETQPLNKDTDASEVITNIFLEENAVESESSESYESDYDMDDQDDTKYAEIIKDIRSAQTASKSNLTLKGGSIKAPTNVRIINAYPWILKAHA